MWPKGGLRETQAPLSWQALFHTEKVRIQEWHNSALINQHPTFRSRFSFHAYTHSLVHPMIINGVSALVLLRNLLLDSKHGSPPAGETWPSARTDNNKGSSNSHIIVMAPCGCHFQTAAMNIKMAAPWEENVVILSLRTDMGWEQTVTLVYKREQGRFKDSELRKFLS